MAAILSRYNPNTRCGIFLRNFFLMLLCSVNSLLFAFGDTGQEFKK